MGSDKFCLKWNDFETNISTAFRELREDSDFFDCTLMSCDDEQVNAHKVILSACSPLFRNILRKNPSREPVLWMKDVKIRDLQAVLTFMYNGEVNVAQDELNSFLSVAEELKVKGLTQSNQQPDRKADQELQQRVKEAAQVAPVKQELEQARRQTVHQVDEQVAAEYHEEGEEYGVEFEDYTKYDGEFPGNDTAEVKGGVFSIPDLDSLDNFILDNCMKDPISSKWYCHFCGQAGVNRVDINRHIEAKHVTLPKLECNICQKTFKTRDSLRRHVNKYHQAGDMSNNITKCEIVI